MSRDTIAEAIAVIACCIIWTACLVGMACAF